MKTITLTLLFALFVSTGYGQSNYEQTMSQTIMGIYQAQTPEKFDELTNTFSRIASVASDKWEPRYYEALAQVFKSFRTEDSAVKDAILDRAHEALTAASLVAPNNSEILALQGFVDMMKLTIDPANRGQSYTPKVMAAFGQALALDPMNPRATLFMAQMKIGTAQFFGTPIDEPCADIARAEELFKKARPTSLLTPMWGDAMIGQYKAMCAGGASGK